MSSTALERSTALTNPFFTPAKKWESACWEAYANQSGGCVKTTNCTSIATVRAQRGKKVLVIDADYQANTSTYFGYDETLIGDRPTLYDVMSGAVTWEQAIVPALYRGEDGEYYEIENLYLVPGADKMADADAWLAVHPNAGSTWVMNMGDDIPPGFDFIMWDCPATKGMLLVSILAGCTDVIGCTKAGEKELKALPKLEVTMAEIRKALGKFGANPQLKWVIGADVPTRDGKVYENAKQDLEEAYGERLLPYIIRNPRVPESFKDHCPVPLYDPKDKITKQYNACVDKMDGRVPASRKQSA